MNAHFNSQKENYKAPYGAVPLGTSVHFRLKTKGEETTTSFLRYRVSTSTDQEHIVPMEVEGQEAAFVYHGCHLTMPENPCLIWYDFLIRSDHEVWYISNGHERLGGEGIVSRDPIAPFQVTVYQEMDGDTQWFSEGVMYQIFVDRFSKGNLAGQYKRPVLMHTDWNDAPCYAKDDQGRILRYDFFGGTLNGILEKLDYLQDLGVTILYLNPIFESASNHKYDTADYLKIDSNFGTEEDFIMLCKAAKDRGIAMILDGVFSHVGSDSRYFNREGFYEEVGAYQSTESVYYPWFRFDHYPDEYESWWGIDTMPNVNEEEESFRSFILDPHKGVIAHWSERGVSGWRLDVADELPDAFIKGIQQCVKEKNPNGIVIGEVWEDASNKVSYDTQREYLYGDELDSVMNYPFREGILRFLRKEESGTHFMKRIASLKENYPAKNFYQLMNFLGTHDTMRILNALIYQEQPDLGISQLMERSLTPQERKLAKKRLHLAVFLLFALPGTPCIYYGDEAGLEGWKDPLNRRTFPWGREDQETMDLYKGWSQRYHAHQALRKGDFIPWETSERSMSFMRKYVDEQLLCIVNAGIDSVEVNMPEAGPWKSLLSGQIQDKRFEIPGEAGDIYIKLDD